VVTELLSEAGEEEEAVTATAFFCSEVDIIFKTNLKVFKFFFS
jgi:hypothetical protein